MGMIQQPDQPRQEEDHLGASADSWDQPLDTAAMLSLLRRPELIEGRYPRVAAVARSFSWDKNDHAPILRVEADWVWEHSCWYTNRTRANCAYCGGLIRRESYDHSGHLTWRIASIVPRCYGVNYNPSNLALVCRGCKQKQGSDIVLSLSRWEKLLAVYKGSFWERAWAHLTRA